MSADIVEIHWNARPHLERLGVNLRRGGIDERGKRLLEEVRGRLAAAFPGSPVLFRISVHRGVPTDDLRVLRQGVEQPDCLYELRTAIDHAVQHAQREAA